MNTGILIVGVTILLISFEGFIQANHLTGDTNTGRSARRRNRIPSNQVESTNRRSQNRQVDGSSSRRGLIEPSSQNRRRTQSRFSDVNTRRRSQVETESNTRGGRRNGRRTRERIIRRRNRINVDRRNDLQNGRRGNGASRTRSRVNTERRTTNERRRSGDVSRAQPDMLNDATSRNGQNGIFEPSVSRRGQNNIMDTMATDRSRNGGDVSQRNIEQRQRNELQNDRRGNGAPRSRNTVNTETRRTTNDVTSGNGPNGIFEPSLSRRGQNDIMDTMATDRSRNGGDVSQRNVEQRQRNELQNGRRGNGASRSRNTVNTETRRTTNERRGPSDVSRAQSDILNDVTSGNGPNGIFEPSLSRRGQNDIMDTMATDRSRNVGDVSLRNVEQRQRNELQNGRRGNGASRSRNTVNTETRRTSNERRGPGDVSRAQSDILNDVTSGNGPNGIFEPSVSRRGQNNIMDTMATDRSRNGGDVSQRNVEQRHRNELQNGRRGNGASRSRNTVDTETRRTTNERRGPGDVSRAQSDILNDVTSGNGQNGIFEPSLSRRGQNDIMGTLPTDRSWNGGDVPQRNVEQRQRNELQNGRRGNGASRTRNTVETGTRSMFDERRGPGDLSRAQSDMLNDVTSINGQNGIFEPTVSRRGQNVITDPIVTDNTRSGGGVSLQTSNIDGNRVILTSAQDGAVRSMRNLIQQRGGGGRGATPRLIGFLIPRSDGRTQLQLMPGARRFLGNSHNNGSLVDNLVKSKQIDGRNASSPFNLRTIINAARRANLLPGGNSNRRQGSGNPAVVVLRSGNQQNGEQIPGIDVMGNNQINQESRSILGRERSTQQQSDIGPVRDPFDIRLDAAGNIVNDRGRADQQSGGVGTFDSGIANTLVQNNRFIDTVLGDPGQTQASTGGFDRMGGLNNNELPSSVDAQFGTNLIDFNSIDIISSGQPNEPFRNTLTDTNPFPPIDRNTKLSIRGQNQPADQSLGNVIGDQSILQPIDSLRGPVDNTQLDPLMRDGNMLSSSKVDQSIAKSLLDFISIQSGRPVTDQFIPSSNKQQDTSISIAQIGSQNIQLLDNIKQGTTVSELPPVVPVQTMNSNPEIPLSANTLQNTDTSSSFSKNTNTNFQSNVLDIQNVPAGTGLNDNTLTGSGVRTVSDRSQNLGTPSGSSNLFPKTSQLDLQLNSRSQQAFPESGNILDVQGRVGSKMLDVSQTQSSKNTLQDKGQFIVTQEIGLQNTNVTGISPKNIEVGVILSNENASLVPQDKQSQSNTNLGQFIHQLPDMLSPTSIPGRGNNTLTEGAFTNSLKTLHINDTYGTPITLNNTLNINDTYGTPVTLNDTLNSSSGKITNTIDSNVLNTDNPARNSAQFASINTKHQVQDPLLMNPEQQNKGMLPNPYIPTNQLQLNGRQHSFNPQTGVPIMASQSGVGLPPTITIGSRSPGFGLFQTNRNINPHDVNTMLGQFSAPIRNIGTQFMQVPVQFSPFMPAGVSINDIRSRIQRQHILQQASNLPRQIQPQNSNSFKSKIGLTKDNSTLKQVNSVSPPRQQPNLTPSVLGTSQDGTVQGVNNNQADLSNGISNGQGMSVQGLTVNSGSSQQMGSTHFTGMGARIPRFMMPRQTAQSNVHLVDQFRSVSNPTGLAFQSDTNPGISQAGAPFLNTMSGPIPLGFQTSNMIARGSNNLNGISTNGLNRQTVPGIQRGTKATMDYNTLKTVISEVLNDFFKHQTSSVKSPKLSHDTVVNTVAQAVIEAKAKSPNLNITNVDNSLVSVASTTSSSTDPLKQILVPSPVDASASANTPQTTLLIEPKKDVLKTSSPQGVLLNISSSGTNFIDVGTQAIHPDASGNYSTSIFVGNVTLNTAFNKNATNKNVMGNKAENIVLKKVKAVTKSIVPPNIVPSGLLLDKVTSGPAAVTASFVEAKTTKASLKLSTTLSPIDPVTTTVQLPANQITMKKIPAEKMNSYKPEFKFTTMSTTLLPHKKSDGLANVIGIKTEVPVVKPKVVVMTPSPTITTRLPDIIVSNPHNSALSNVVAAVPSSNTDVNKGPIPIESMTFNSKVVVDKFPNDLGKGGYNFDVPLNSNGQIPRTLTIETSLFDAGQRKTSINSVTRNKPSNMQDNRNSQLTKNHKNSFASPSGSSLNIEGNLQQGPTNGNSKVSNRHGNSFASPSGSSLNFEGNLHQGPTNRNSQVSNKQGNLFASSGNSLNIEGNLHQSPTNGNSKVSKQHENLFASSSGSSLNIEGNLLQGHSNGNSMVLNRHGNSFSSHSGSSLNFEGNLHQGSTNGNSMVSNRHGNSFASPSGSSLNFEGNLHQGPTNGNSKVSNRHGNTFVSPSGSSLNFEGNLHQSPTNGNSKVLNGHRNSFASPSGSSLNFEGNLHQGHTNGNSQVSNKQANLFASSGSSLNFEGNLLQGHSNGNSKVSNKHENLFASSSGSSLNIEGNLLQGHSNGNSQVSNKQGNLFASSGSSLNIEGNLHQSPTNGNSKVSKQHENSFALSSGSSLNIEGNLHQNEIATQSGDRSFSSRTSHFSNGHLTPSGIRNRFAENLLSRGFGTSNTETRRQLSGGISVQESKRNGDILPEIVSSNSNMGVRIGRHTSSRTPTDINNIGGLSSDTKRLSQGTIKSLHSPLNRKRSSTNAGVIYSPSVNTFKFSSRFFNNQQSIQNEPKPRIVDPIVPSSTLQTVNEAVTVKSFVTPPSFVNGIISDSTSINIDSVDLGTVQNIPPKTIPDVILPAEPGKVTDFVASSIVGDSAPPPVPQTLTKLNKSSSVSFNDSLMVGSGAMSHNAYFEYSLQPMHRMTNDKKAFIINNELAKNVIVTDTPREVSKNAKATEIVSSTSTRITNPVLSNFNNKFNL